MNQPALRQSGDEPMNEASLSFAAYAVFGSGLAVGLTNIASGCVNLGITYNTCRKVT